MLGVYLYWGQRGFVKPISATAYLDSIKTEINFAYKNGFREIIFTLGNSSFEFAKRNYKIEQIIEIGNFIYDSFKIADEVGFDRATLILGAGKCVKVAQGFKNTHNRFGLIDFKALKRDIRDNLGVEIREETKTVKHIISILNRHKKDKEFYKLIVYLAEKRLKKWFGDNKNISIKLNT